MNPPPDDVALVNKLASSNEAEAARAFDTIVNRYATELHAYMHRWSRGHTAVQDILQEALFHVWVNRRTINAPHGLRAHLYVTVRGYALRHLRAERRSDERDAKYLELETPSGESTPLQSVLQSEASTVIQKAVNSLSPGAREAWQLCREQGLSYPEAAAVLGVSVNTIKTQMGRALRVIRAAAGPLLSLIIAGSSF